MAAEEAADVAARAEADLAASLRIGVMRLSRRLRVERAGDDLTLTQLVRARHAGPPRRPADRRDRRPRERQAAVDDAHRRLPRGARPGHPPPERDGRPPGRRRPHRRGAAGHGRRPPPARCLARPAPRRPHPGATGPAARGRAAPGRAGRRHEPLGRDVQDVRRPQVPQLPPVRRRLAAVQHRHVDAARRPGLAGARAHGQRRGPRHHHRAAVPADAAVLAVRRRPRRPLREEDGAQLDAGADGHHRPGDGLLGDHRPDRALARLPPHVPLRHGGGPRRAGPPGVRQRDGRPRVHGQRRGRSGRPRSTWPG